MATKIIMPQGGQDLTEGKVVQWLKSEGDAVKKGEVVCEVETEKAVFEVSAPADGILLKITTPAGEVAEVFSAIGFVGESGEQTGQDEKQEGKKEDTVKPTQKTDVAAIRKQPGEEQAPLSKRIKISGRAKKLATQQGVDYTRITGTGPGGRIVEKDILAVLVQAETVPPPVPQAPATVAAPQPAPGPVLPKGVQGKTEPLSKIRKVIARRLQQSKQTIPHFYVTVSVEMTAALKLREELNAQVGADSPAKISINDMIVKAAALALEEFYQVNCVLQDDDTLLYLETINIGIAVSLDDGLIVPVLPDVDVLSLKGIAKKSKELVAQAKAGKIALTQGSFTISNMGMLDVENFAAIINPPESAILAVSSVQKGVVVSENNDISIRDIMKMTISADHRVVDGVVAAKFINKIKYHLQNPKTLLI